MILALLLASAPVMTAVDAERAFAADAQKLGQWTAFRKWAAADATMFAPQPVKAQAYLKDKKDPAKALDWWPTASYVSCDGSLAVNTGGWKAPGGAVGYFTTVWQRQKDGGWKWIVDGGDDLKVKRPRALTVLRSACSAPAEPAPNLLYEGSPIGGARGDSDDGTLHYQWDASSRSRTFLVWRWNGKDWSAAINESVRDTRPVEVTPGR